MYENEKAFGKMKGAFFKSMREENVKCLEPSELCQENLIRSHSVQDSRILEQLAVNQHVYILKPDLSEVSAAKLDEFAEPQIEFKLESIHEATTFKGLCNAHDTQIFQPIDTEDLDMENSYHIFLLAYRAVLKELSTLIGTSKMMQKSFLEKVKLGAVKEDIPSIEGMLPVMQIQRAYSFYEYKKKYDDMYLNKIFDNLYYEYIVLGEKSKIAVSSIFTPMEMAKRKDFIEYIGINIFPYNDKTYVVFSCLNEDKEYMKNYIRDTMNASGVYQKYLLSKIVLRNCENIVIAPIYFDSWTKSKKETVLKYFKETCFSDKIGFESEEIFLF